MQLGMGEMIFIFLLALVIFGPKKLPEIGRQLGKAMNEFKRASNEFRSQLEEEIRQIDAVEQAKKLAAPSGTSDPLDRETAGELTIAPPREAIAQNAVIDEANAFSDEQAPSPDRAEDRIAAAAGSNGHATEIVSPAAPLEELNTQEFNG